MFPNTIPAGWQVKDRWTEEIVPGMVSLKAQEADLQAQCSEAKAYLAYVEEHVDELPWSAQDEARQEVMMRGLALAEFMQQHLTALEMADRLGV